MNRCLLLIASVLALLLCPLTAVLWVRSHARHDMAVRAVETPPASATQPTEDQKLDDATLAKLNRPLSTFQFSGVDFQSCLGYFEQVGGVKIVVPWDEVYAAGINQYKPISFHFYKGTLANGLRTVLGAAAGKSGVLYFTVKHGDILIVVKGASPATQRK